jgi:DNA-binding transcriptional MerR regulator/methylmalonyl-CoA mutase cobalamin-binding subunit
VSTPSKAPTYNLKVVLQETGIKPDTLRAWERRYGLPVPERSPGGHRLYSQYDIETIKWLQARQEEGLRINRAVDLWRSMQDSGQDPLLVMPVEEVGAPTITGELVSGKTLDEMKDNWIAACMAYDEPTAETILAQAFARYPLETVCLEVLRRGLSEIGTMWYSGESTVQQEHFASALAIRRLDALLAAAPGPTRKGRVLIACPPAEDHIFSPLMITLFLRHRGYDVIYLGANVPLSQLNKTINNTKPNLVVLTAQQLTTAATLFQVAQSLSEQKVSFGYGGLIFNLLPGLRNRIPGHFLGETLEQAVQEIEHLVSHTIESPHVENVSEVYHIAQKQFTEKRPLIEAYLWNVFQSNGMQEHHLEIANEFLGKDIQAGLILGDMEFLVSEMDWIRSLLENHNIPREVLPHYLKLYRQALEVNLSEAGQPVIDWLDRAIAEEKD